MTNFAEHESYLNEALKDVIGRTHFVASRPTTTPEQRELLWQMLTDLESAHSRILDNIAR